MINRDVSCLLTHGVLNAEGVPGKPEWRGMLDCVAALRRRSVFPAEPPLPFDWLDIGPGYCYGPAFGHIDLAHQVLDFAATDPDLARRQMLNQLAIQREDGSIACPWMGENPARFFVK